MENQTSNETLMEKALDTFRTILGMGKIALPELAKAAPEAVPSPVESDELTADEMTELNKILADTDFEKREFSDKQRKHLASQGIALPDGSYPIANVSDLENAVKAFGRASDPEKAKAHIISRAKALNATHLLPADWPGSTKQKESTIMATDLQKRFGAMHKAAIKKADDHIKKASASHGKAVDELEALHKCMGKAADGGDEFKKHLTALSGHMNDIADHHELAHAALGKAMTGWDGEKAETDLGEEPASENVEELSPRRMTEGEVEGNTFRGAGDSPYSAAAIATMVKAAVAEATAPLIADNAFLKGQMSVIENQPSAGRRPKLFVASSTGDVFPASDGKADFNRMINKSLSEADPNDQRSSEQATARAFGLMCTPGSGFAKSINDPNFKIDLGGN
jgi:flagellar hook-basal body complex protein FliE